MCCLFQELEALKSQVQSQSAEISQLKTEREDLLRRAEAGVTKKKAKMTPMRNKYHSKHILY